MYKLIADSVATALALKPLVANANHCEVVIAPVFTALKTVADRLEGSNIRVAGQNCSTETQHGAHTGEIAADMLRDAGCTHVIIGHSERRHLYSETDSFVQRKTRAALDTGLTAIVCVGETLEERESNETLAVLDRQLKDGFDRLTAEQVAELVVAYEPVWAIGTGRNATAAQAEEAHAHIRTRLRQWFGAEAAERCHVIYGGSVKPDNIADLIREPDVDGALVGGASLDVRSFGEIVTRSRGAAL